MALIQHRIIFLLPCLIFLHAAWIYTLNIPFWDDYSVVLLPMVMMHEAMARGDIKACVDWLFHPNAGHLPMLTHAIAWVQVQWFGGINFRWSTIVGDLGLVLTVIVLARYFMKNLQLDLPAVIPLPFLLLALVHWECMDFMVPAWQFYWGSCLFPLLMLMAVTEYRWLRAALAFIAALFLSSGTLALYPIAVVYAVLHKQWRGLLLFGVTTGLALLVYFHYLPPASVDKGLPDVSTTLIFILSFMGSAIPNPSGHLYPLMFFHILLGIAVLVLGIFLLWRETKADLLKLLFIYIVALAVMALVARGYSVNTQIPSRYAVFSLWALVCLYGLLLMLLKAGSIVVMNRCVTTMTVIAMFFWVYSAYSCRQILEMNQASRIVATQSYLRGNKEVLASVLWDKDFGEDMLQRARQHGIYDMKNSGIR